MSQWTPIDKLPPPGVEVLWAYETGEMTLYARDDDDDMRGHDPALTHWMPLPSADLIEQQRTEAFALCAGKTCEYSQQDGCCGNPDSQTPECHEWSCPMPNRAKGTT